MRATTLGGRVGVVPYLGLVTGASQGIGRATALRLASQGTDVFVHYRRHQAEANEVAGRIRGMGHRAWTVFADLERPEAVSEIVRAVVRETDQLDVLVHNAGEYPRRAFRDLTPEEFESVFRPHVFAPAALTRALLPLLERSPSGRVIFVSSSLAFSGSSHGAHYAAAKAALLGLARSLARELGPKITVNVVAPGPIDTAILAGDSPETRAHRIAQLPARRIGTADDVAGAIAYLASPEAGFITGTTLHVNGGPTRE